MYEVQLNTCRDGWFTVGKHSELAIAEVIYESVVKILEKGECARILKIEKETTCDE